jgi:hypothetical protein
VHVHISAVEFLATASYVIIFGFLWRTLAAYLSDSPFGQAMAFIY